VGLRPARWGWALAGRGQTLGTVCPVTDEQTRVGDLSEAELLARVFPLLPVGRDTLLGPGDDAAVLSAPDGRVVVSTDVLVEGHHFRRDWSTGADVGWRAAVQNLADVAAMGARPTGMVVALVLPVDLPVGWVTGFARGLHGACSPHGVGVVGGDLSAGDAVVVAVTVHGDLAGRPPVLRSGAQPGDVVAFAGVQGRSAAGLALLQAGHPRSALDLVEAYRRPRSPLGAGPDAAAAGATAMLDVSDGLLRDAGRLAEASGVTLDLLPLTVAFPADLAAVAGAARLLGADPAEWVLTGGEDHGLLATFPAGTPVPDPFRVVGHVRPVADGSRATEGAVLVDGHLPAVSTTGWDHFAR
jgi:thiamine-monophosphate kinase